MVFGFFGRGRNRDHSAPKGTAADSQPDAELPQLNRGHADLLRRELAYRFATEGAEITIEGDAAMVVRSDGGRAHVSLRTLAVNAADLNDYSQLPELVTSFVNGTLADAALGELSTADLYASLRMRLLPSPRDDEDFIGMEQQIREDSVIRDFTSDTSIALVLDTEHAIRVQPLSELEQFDDLRVLERAADRNTWRELSEAEVSATHVVHDDGGPGSSFWAFESSSYYLGSAPLFLSDLVARWAPDLDQSRGIIFAVPDRDLLLAREVTTGGDLMNGITAMVRIAMRFGLGTPTSVSPRLHLLYDGQISTFTDYRILDPETASEWNVSGDEGEQITPTPVGIEVRPDPYLTSMLQDGEFGLESFDEDDFDD